SDIPPSLLNIFKEIKLNYDDFVVPTHGDISSWGRQGILLLNKCLTVLPNQPGSHKDIWDGFIYRVIEGILNINPKCIFVLWGKKAQEIKKMLKGRGIVL